MSHPSRNTKSLINHTYTLTEHAVKTVKSFSHLNANTPPLANSQKSIDDDIASCIEGASISTGD